MSRGPVGWYVHHVGSGHLTTARLVAPLMRTPVVVLSSAPRPAGWPEDRWVALPLDDAPGGHAHEAGGALHWAPLDHGGYRDRMAAVAAWVASAHPSLLVSDVSVEVTLMARLLGVPVATMVMAGDRSDRPHRLAYDAATLLFAPFPEGAEVAAGLRPAWRRKTVSLGALSRFDDRRPTPVTPSRRVTMLWGHGGSAVTDADVRAAMDATPGWSWTVCDTTDPDEVWSLLQAAEVVVAHAGQSVVAEVAAARRPAVIVPQPRPHDEQSSLASGLADLGLTPRVGQWPAPEQWPGLLTAARRSDPAGWVRWSDGRGAPRMAGCLDRLAAEGTEGTQGTEGAA
ncbi:MAG: glycosyltransferase [Lapillicoccus sp.]